MFFGNLVLLFIVIYILKSRRAGLSVFDGIYWGVVFLIISVRYIDIAKLEGLTSEGKPATIDSWRKYSIEILAVTLLVWLAAHGLAYFL